MTIKIYHSYKPTKPTNFIHKQTTTTTPWKFYQL